MEENTINFDIVIINNPIVKYSPFAFGTAFANVEYLFDEKISKTQKNFEDYFKVYGPIVDCDGNSYTFKNITTLSTTEGVIYHLNFK